MYKVTNARSNLAFNGIARGLIENKTVFWYTTILSSMIIWSHFYIIYTWINYLTIPMFLVCIYSYFKNVMQTLYLLKFLR